MQNDPLKPGYNFDAHLVAGLTPIIKGNAFDFVIDRPKGMKGYILNMTSEGQGTVFSGDKAFHVKAGELLLFPSATPHFYHRKQGCVSWFHHWIYFRPKGVWADLLQWHENRHGVYLTQALPAHIINELEKLFTEITSVSKSGKAYHDDLALNLLEQLLIRCKVSQPDIVNKRMDPRIIEIINTLSMNLNKDFSNKDLADSVYLSSSRLGHLFLDEVGLTLSQWRIDQRITRAKQLLVTTNHTINQISIMVGYDDPLYFSRIFKRKAGVSPKQYRET